MFLGNIFRNFPKFRVVETIDFTGFPNLFPEMNENGKSKNIFEGNGKSIFGENLPLSGNLFIFGKSNFGKKNLLLGKSQQK